MFHSMHANAWMNPPNVSVPLICFPKDAHMKSQRPNHDPCQSHSDEQGIGRRLFLKATVATGVVAASPWMKMFMADLLKAAKRNRCW